MTDRDVRNICRGELAAFCNESPILRVDEGDRPADQIQGWADGTSTDDGQWTLSRLEQYGDIVVPPGKGTALCLRVGENGVAIPRNSPRWRPTGVSKRGNRGIHADKGNLVLLHGSGSATPGAVEIITKSGAKVVIDKDGGIQVAPAAGQKVKLGSAADAEVDPVVLYAKLKTEFDAFVGKYNAHKHATAAPGPPVVPDVLASLLTPAVGSSNVVAKK